MISNDQNFQCDNLLQKDSIFNDGETLWKIQEFENQKLIDNSRFKICTNKKCKTKQISMFETYIRYSTKKIIYYENSIMDYIHNSQNQLIGFRLTKYDGSVDIIGECKTWIKKLKKYVIQGDMSRNFKIIKKIGNGTQAQVFLVKHKKTNKEYAAKMYDKKKILLEDKEIEMIIKEVQITRLCQSNHLCQLYEVFECKKHLTLIMDLLEGSELVYSLKVGGLTEIQSILIIKPLFQVVAQLHEKGIFHRDIKPQNIMFRQFGKLESACLIDLGLAEFWNNKNEYLFNQCGTPGYVAPELILGYNYDLKVDVYSLGLVLYLILTGKEPFKSTNVDDLIEENAYGYVPLQGLDVSQNCQDFLQKILAKNPQNRLSSSEALEHPFLVFGPGNHLELLHDNQVQQINSSKSLRFRKSIACLRVSTEASCDNTKKNQIVENHKKQLPKKFSIRKVKM